MTALPPEIKFGKVVGRWALAVADAADEDEYPDVSFPTGKVTFKRLDVNTVLLDTLQNDGTFIGIARKDVEAELGPDGELRLAGKSVGGVWLAVGSWQVTPVIADSNWTAFPIVVKETHTALAPLDLLAWSPIIETPTVVLVASIETALRAESAASRAELAAETAESFAIPTLVEDPLDPGLFDYEQVGAPLTVEQALVAQDADANSDFRVQQDARHMSTYAPRWGYGAVGNLSAIDNWDSAISGRLHIAAIGDSITAGAWSSTTETNWPLVGPTARLQTMLRTKYGDGGRGYIGLWKTDWAVTGTWSTNADYGPWGICKYTTSNANAYTLTCYGDNAELYYVNNGAMTFSYEVDGGAPVTVTATSPYTNQSRAVSVSLGTVAAHTIKVNGPTVGTLFLQGASVYTGTTGVVVHNIGKSSMRAYDAQIRFNDRHSMMIAHFPPKVTLLNLLANDYSSQNNSNSYLPAYQSSMGIAVAAITAIGSDVVVWQPPDTTVVPLANTWTLAQYEAAAKAVAVAGGAAWADVHADWGTWAQNSDRMYDTQHPNGVGAREIARLLHDVLMATSAT